MKLRNDSKQVAKVDVRIAPGDVLDVPDDVAEQLQAQSTHFVPSDAPVGSPEPEGETTADAEDDEAGAEPTKAAPAKRAGRRASKRP